MAKGEKKRALAMLHLSDLPEGIPATPEERGYASCPCSEDCVLHGSCHLRTAYHVRKGKLPRCER